MFTPEELRAITEKETLRGGFYELYNAEGRSLWDYRSAFSILLTRPILSIDQDLILSNLLKEWQTAKPEISTTLEITYGNQEEYLDSNG